MVKMLRAVVAGGSASGWRGALVEDEVAALGPGPGGVGGGRVLRIVAGLLVGLALAAAWGSVAQATGGQIYWANASSNTIGEADLDGSHVNQSFITETDGPSDVLVYGQHIYWANPTGGCTEAGSCAGTIGEANLNGTDVEGGLPPRHHTVRIGCRRATTSTGRNTGSDTIGRANLNGSDVNQHFITGLNQPDGVVVDTANQKIYWTNFGTNAIGEANLDRTDVNLTFITGADAPEGMAIDSQYIYWVNHGDTSIGRADLGRGRRQPEVHLRRRRLADQGRGQQPARLLDDMDTGRRPVNRQRRGGEPRRQPRQQRLHTQQQLTGRRRGVLKTSPHSTSASVVAPTKRLNAHSARSGW